MRRGALGSITAGAMLLAACSGGGDDGGGAIEENVVAPGVTAIQDASSLACGADVDIVSTALQSYEMLEGSPAPDEAALVEAGFLREPSELVDVVDGRIVAQDPGCASAVPPAPVPAPTTPSGSAPLTAPATDLGEIVTSVAPVQQSTDEVLALMSDVEIETYGGVECATQIAAIIAAGQAFVAREGRAPGALDELAADLDREITLWTYDSTRQSLVPADGSPCPDVL